MSKCCLHVDTVFDKHALKLACNTSALVGAKPCAGHSWGCHAPCQQCCKSAWPCKCSDLFMPAGAEHQQCHRQSMQICNFTCKDAHKVHETLSFNKLGGTSRLTPSSSAVVGLSDETSGALRIPQPGGEATPHGALQGQLASASHLQSALFTDYPPMLLAVVGDNESALN